MSAAARVSVAEHAVIRLTRASLLGQVESAHSLLRLPQSPPKVWSPSAVRALTDSVRIGFLRRTAMLGPLNPPPENLVTTTQTVRLAAWALNEPLASTLYAPFSEAPSGALGDAGFAFALADLLVRSGLTDVLQQRIFARNPLVELAYAHLIPGGNLGELTSVAPLLQMWEGDITRGILHGEAAEHDLPRCIAAAKHRRARYTACLQSPNPTLRAPLYQAACLAMAKPAPSPLGRPDAPLSERTAAARATTVLAEVALSGAAWHAQLGQLEFFDEGYAEAQALRRRWAALAAAGAVAEARLRQVASV